MVNGKSKTVVKALVIGAIVVVIGVAGALAGANIFPKEVPNPVNAKLQSDLSESEGKLVSAVARIKQLEENPITITEIEEVPVNVTVEKLVEVDNGKLDEVLQHIYDNDGKVEYLTEDLKESEIDQIVDRVDFINSIKKLAVDEVELNGENELDKEKLGSFEFDDKDFDRFRVESDATDIQIDDVDFEDQDADVYVDCRVDQDGKAFTVKYLVEFRDGEVDDISVDSITER